MRLEYRGYREADLVSNRASLLLYGGTATDRKAWAQEAQRSFPEEGALREVTASADLAAALAVGRGVLYVPDVTALGVEAQRQLVRCLVEREERPKVVVGLPLHPDEAVTRGVLREDLRYRLQLAQVDLSVDETRNLIHARRQQVASQENPLASNEPPADKPATPAKKKAAPRPSAAKKAAKEKTPKK